MRIKPIETIYSGYRFRSRCEARWAVFFDALGIRYEYEPEGYDLGEAGWYLPDFWLPDHGEWVEIKGGPPTEEELAKAEALCAGTQQPVTVFVGNPWYSIMRFNFVWDSDGDEVLELAEYDHNPLFDYSELDGKGAYYQGWKTWGIVQGSPQLIMLVERDDVERATDERMADAYRAARQARFEHGETPVEPCRSCHRRYTPQGSENPFANEMPDWLAAD